MAPPATHHQHQQQHHHPRRPRPLIPGRGLATNRAPPPAWLPLIAIVAFRLANAACVVTFFQPDEFFQSLEPAWGLAFGPQSRPWITWEWHHQLRSSLHPVLFSAAYIVADRLSRWLPAGAALRTAMLLAAPKALQAVIAALGDWYTWQLAVDIFGPGDKAANVVLCLQLLSPWQWYVSTRTFSNSLETTLTAMALYHWPWQLLGPAAAPAKGNPRPAAGRPPRPRASLCLAALAVVLRPTNVLIWAAVVAMALARPTLRGPSPLTAAAALALARDAALCGGAVLAVSLASDRLYFGAWTFPPLHWLRFNISQSLAVFYGRNPWHYYLIQGVPLLCTTSLPFALRGLFRPAPAPAGRANTLRTLAATVVATVGALSLVSHKEVRFIYPLLPALNVLAAPPAAAFFLAPPPSPAGPGPRLRRRPLLLAAVAANLCLAGYLSRLHQPAPMAVVSHLRAEYERIHPPGAPPAADGELFALFLTPCHSTPWRSHLVHAGLAAYALSCEPPLRTRPGSAARAAYRDEADRFYADPRRFLRAELFAPPPAGRALPAPRFVVAFEGLEPALRAFFLGPDAAPRLGVRRLRPVWAAANGLFSDDARRAGRMLVWETGAYDDGPPPPGLPSAP